jgi:NhaP-type Na+/H+ or K+/H+ antiporter
MKFRFTRGQSEHFAITIWDYLCNSAMVVVYLLAGIQVAPSFI